jgi:hypothetical protein
MLRERERERERWQDYSSPCYNGSREMHLTVFYDSLLSFHQSAPPLPTIVNPPLRRHIAYDSCNSSKQQEEGTGSSSRRSAAAYSKYP